MMKIGKNCINCIFLVWSDGDVNDPQGWSCDGRGYKSELDESNHLSQLDRYSYLCRSKKCCVLKTQ